MAWVFDASIAAAWCFDSEKTPATEALLDRLGSESAAVPNLFHLEIANVLTQALRQKAPRLTPEKRRQFLELLGAAPIHVDDQTARQAWDATLALADRHKLSTYDAAYLELALRLHAELATLDVALRKAAGVDGVCVIPASA